jgi:phenylacetate-CoA ligase
MRTRVLASLRSFERSQWLSAAEFAALQEEKLARLIRHAYHHVPYYCEVMRQRKLRPADVRTVADLPKLPVLTRRTAQSERQRLRSDDARRRGAMVKRTSGSTDQPLLFLGDRQSKSAGLAALLRAMQWAGYRLGQPWACLMGRAVRPSRSQWLRARVGERLLNRRSLDAYRLSEERMRRYAQRLARQRPVLLRGYVSALVRLACFMHDHGLGGVELRALSTTAEALLDTDRTLLEEHFAAPVFDQYGCGEVMGVAAECAAHTGLHINPERAIVELIARGDPTASAAEGEVLLTDLDNFAMPFIRYANGDCASLAQGPCPCGRAMPRLRAVSGRARDTIVGPAGEAAQGMFFAALLEQHRWVARFALRQFQVVQTAPDALRIDVVCAVAPGQDAVAELTERIVDYLGDMDVRVERVDRIEPGPSGKHRATRPAAQPPGSTPA